MIIKFFPTGKGSARSAFNYLLNDERVKAGTAKLMGGSPESITFLTEQRMKSSNYRGGALYTSGVISFSKDEKPTNAQLRAIVDGFNEAMFPNLDKSRFNRAWILHTDKERTELHFVIQNLDLETGKAYTPFVEKRDLSRINAFKNQINAKYGFLDPNKTAENTHFFVKKHKNLTAEQRDFIDSLNREYSEFKRDIDKAFNSTHINESYASSFAEAMVKQDFLKSHLKTRFSHVKINRSSDSYISLDFGTGPKLRVFYEKQVAVADPTTDLRAVKIEQNKSKGLIAPKPLGIQAELMESYNRHHQKAVAEEQRKRREEAERKAKLERKEREAQEKALLLARQAEELALQRQKDEEEIKRYENLFLDKIGRSITGSGILAREKPEYYNNALKILDTIGEKFGNDVKNELFEKHHETIEKAYKGITGQSLNLRMGM